MPPVLNYPGVYIEELPSAVHTITGVATSIAAFVGWAPQGPVNEAVQVLSFPDFQNQFGGLDARSYLGYAVNQFFSSGGQQAEIVRVVWDGTLTPAAGTSPLPSATAYAPAVGIATTNICASLGGVAARSPLTVGPKVLLSISITPVNPPSIPIGLTQQFTATGHYSDGTTQTLTTVTWGPSASAPVTVNGSGLATANSTGTAQVTASVGLVSASVPVTVTGATLTGVTVSPASPSIGVNQWQQLSASAAYSNGTSQDVTDSAVWKSSNTSDATVNSTGLVTGVAAGSPNITATWGGITATASVTVAAVLLSIALTPANPTEQLSSGSLQFTPTGNLSDNSPPATLTTGVSWNSSNLAVASISSGGLATLAGTGSTVITVTVGLVSTSTTLTVTTAKLNAISIAPASLSVADGLTQKLTATGSYADGSLTDLSGSVTWTPADKTVVSISPTGWAKGLKNGSNTTVTAEWAGVTSSAVTITVTPPVLQSIAVTPNPASLLTGQTQQFTATGSYSDGTTPNITTSVKWSSSNTGVATVNPTTGLAAAVAVGGTLTLFANSPGVWGNNLTVNVTLQPGNTGRFSIQVQYNGAVVESFSNLSTSSIDPQYVVTVINNDSNYISFINPGNKLPVVPTGVPASTNTPVALNGGADGAVLNPQDGVNGDGNFEIAIGSDPAASNSYGIHLLDRVEIFNLLCVPGETEAVTIQNLQTYCVGQRAFYIVDSPLTATASSLAASGPAGWNTGSLTESNSDHSAYYFPWVMAPDPLAGNRIRPFPPSPFAAGIYAATDASRGVWKAPAGIDASLSGVSGLQYVLTDAENGVLNVQAINCLREFRVYGDVVWGARTLQGNDQAGSQWKYIPVRRLALFLESSLYDGTKWVVFEPNDETLWGQVRLNVGTFMQFWFLQGAFSGTTPDQAYFVKCDAENNPPSSRALGILNILVGFAPVYPAEFVVIQIQQIAQSQ